MSPRWNWDFEDEQARDAATAHAATANASRRRGQVRRRRALAALGLAAVVAAVAVLLDRPRHASTAAAHALADTPRPGHSPRRTAAATPAPAAAVTSVLAYTQFVKEGGDRGRDIALTFDDGPGPYTPEVLDVLERFHVHATFFVIGKMLRYFSASVEREIRDGDAIGDHTETHPEMALLSAHEQHEQLYEQIARIELLGGPRPDLFRPPYGSFDATTMHELHKLHLLMVLWSVDTNDYELPGVQAIVSSALGGAHPGAIILMHDAGGDRSETVAALPTIIRRLRGRGYRLVTVPELLRDDPPAPGQPLPSSLAGD